MHRRSELGTLGKNFEIWSFCEVVGTCQRVPKKYILRFQASWETPSTTRKCYLHLELLSMMFRTYKKQAKLITCGTRNYKKKFTSNFDKLLMHSETAWTFSESFGNPSHMFWNLHSCPDLSENLGLSENSKLSENLELSENSELGKVGPPGKLGALGKLGKLRALAKLCTQ